MAKAESAVVHQLDALLASGSLTGLSDRLLLERFVSEPGEVAEAAFAALAARHGPMVFKVCRTMLADHQDAQDAFQVTFALLAAKANRLRDKHLLANWLYGVAMRSALKIRSNSARRRRHERRVAERTHEAVAPVELHAEDYKALYEEIDALPERYRGPVVLCHLEGLSREMAASLLDCPVSTLNVRLLRARNRLKERLANRQFHLPAGSVVSMLDGSTRIPLSASTAQLAMDAALGKAGTLSPLLVALTKEVQTAMLMTKLKFYAGILLTLGVVTAGVGTVARSQSNAERAPSVEKGLKPSEPREREKRAGRNPASKPISQFEGSITFIPIDPKEFPNPTGWSWLMWPQRLQTGMKWIHPNPSNDGFVSGYSHIDSTDGSLHFYFIQVAPMVDIARPARRLVVLDAAKNRHLPSMIDYIQGSGWSQGSSLTQMGHAVYRLDRNQLDPAKATYIGVEQIDHKQNKP